MAYTVRFSEAADADFDGVLHFIAQDNPLRAISLVDERRQKTVEALELFSNAGRQFGAARMLAFGNYVVVYRVDDAAKAVSVILVTEGHRDWQKLMEDVFDNRAGASGWNQTGERLVPSLLPHYSGTFLEC